MDANHSESHPFTDEDITTIFPGPPLRGTFHTPQVPADALSAVTPYMTPNPQGFTNFAIGSPNLWAANNSPQEDLFPYMINQAGERLPIAKFTDCKAETGIDQINGFVIVCEAETIDVQSPQGRYYYKGCKKLGSGAQVNGLDLVYHGGSKHLPAAPAILGRWENMDMLNSDGKEVKGATKNQINGGRIRPMRRSDMGMSPGVTH